MLVLMHLLHACFGFKGLFFGPCSVFCRWVVGDECAGQNFDTGLWEGPTELPTSGVAVLPAMTIRDHCPAGPISILACRYASDLLDPFCSVSRLWTASGRRLSAKPRPGRTAVEAGQFCTPAIAIERGCADV